MGGRRHSNHKNGNGITSRNLGMARRAWIGPVTVQRKQPPGGVTIVMAEG